MKRTLIFFLLVCCFNLFSCGVSSNIKSAPPQKDTTKPVVQKKFPKATAWVNDFEDLLTNGQEKELDSICRTYQDATTNQIVIATIDSIEPYTTIEDYSTELFNYWQLGTKEKNNGLLFIVFKKLHKARIEAGLGTEKILTNDVCDEIMANQLIPNFKEDKYYEGLKAGVQEAIKKWK